MATFYYQGHGSYRITTNDGTVIYLDPFAGGGYDVPADLILVTHEHGDHNQVDLPAKKPGCVIWRAADFLQGGAYQTKTLGGVTVQAVEAYNKNHPRAECVGYVLSFDGIQLYAAGDTSATDMMGSVLPAMRLDYAILPVDGYYNMGPEEASDCAKRIGARHTIPVHSSPTGVADPWLLWDEAAASKLDAPGRLLVRDGEAIEL